MPSNCYVFLPLCISIFMLEWRAEAHCGRPSFNCYYGTHNCTLLYNIAAHIPQEKTTPLYIQEAQNNSIVVDFPVSFSSFLLPIYLWVFMFFFCFFFYFLPLLHFNHSLSGKVPRAPHLGMCTSLLKSDLWIGRM